MNIFGREVPSEAFGNIRGNRHARFPDLMPEDELIVASKTTRHAIAFCEVHRFLPNEQFTERSDLRHVTVEGTEPAATEIAHFDGIGRRLRKSCDIGEVGNLPNLRVSPPYDL